MPQSILNAASTKQQCKAEYLSVSLSASVFPLIQRKNAVTKIQAQNNVSEYSRRIRCLQCTAQQLELGQNGSVCLCLVQCL